MLEGVINLFESLFQKRFKIGIISYHYPFQKHSTSGVGTHAYNLVTTLCKLGCEVHVFTFGEEDTVKRINVGEGKVILHFINSNLKHEIEDSVISKRVMYSVFENLVLREVGLEHFRRNFEIIHTHGWLTGSAFMLKYLYKIPWVHTVHALERNRLSSMSEEEKRLYRITSWVEDTLSSADKLIAVSNSTSKEIIKVFGSRIAKKIEVIPNGVD